MRKRGREGRREGEREVCGMPNPSEYKGSQRDTRPTLENHGKIILRRMMCRKQN